MPAAGIVLVFFALALIATMTAVYRGARADSMMAQWAEANGLRLLSEDRRTFFKGPFFWTSTKGQMIYYVTVQDSAGRVRHAWVRCGGYVLGMLSDNFEVSWED